MTLKIKTKIRVFIFFLIKKGDAMHLPFRSYKSWINTLAKS